MLSFKVRAKLTFNPAAPELGLPGGRTIELKDNHPAPLADNKWHSVQVALQWTFVFSVFVFIYLFIYFFRFLEWAAGSPWRWTPPSPPSPPSAADPSPWTASSS